MTKSTADNEKELVECLEGLKQRYSKQIQPDHRKYLDNLSEQALHWKKLASGPVMFQTLTPFPVSIIKKTLDSMLHEYDTIEDEYFYCVHNRKGRVWEEKKDDFKAFKEVALKLHEVLDNMHEILVMEDYTPDLDDIRDLYCYKDTRIQKKRETEQKIGISDERAEAQWEKDSQWVYHSYPYHKTLKTSLQRELNCDVHQYFEKLYRKFLQWKEANRPSISPLAHPCAVFQSLQSTADAISLKIMHTVGYVPLMELFQSLSNLAHELWCGVSSLQQALEEEDSIDEDTVGVLQTVEEHYAMRRLSFLNHESLDRVYEDASF
ncbi:hypothetical protein AAF712_007412 [Marasmius tenuissimus]|uniref:Uncharacterized protein n=1 Tax=Marasmius tenuissimus TaxID=585030 RepID=A0ABR2ZXW2_9AGAR